MESNDFQELNTKYHRPWGYYVVIARGEGFQSKILHVNKNQRLSVQSHNFRNEHWVVVSGRAKVILGDEGYILEKGQSVDIPVKEKHSLQNPFDSDIEVLEVQFGDNLSEDDIIRYEDIYGRV